MNVLTDSDRTRYHRQMLLREWGEVGQQKLKDACVFIAGAGGLGSPVAIYLAVAGVGEIRICDRDKIELSNLVKTEKGSVKEFSIKIARGAATTTKPAAGQDDSDDDEAPF